MPYDANWNWIPDPTPTPTGGSSTLDALTKFLSSPGGAAAIRAAGGAFSAYGQAQQADAQRQETATETAVKVLANESRDDRLNADGALTPLGESQNFVAHNALMNAILPNLRNFNSGMGQQPGRGSFLPQGGLDPSMVNSLYGSTPTLESLSQRAKQLSAVNPQAPTENFANLGGITAPQADPFMTSTKTYQGQQQQKQTDQRNEIQSFLAKRNP